MATMMESHSQQRRPSAGNRPRSKSAFSITSDKSERSEGAKNRESQDEKHKLAFSNTTKANPNAAMNELQPIAQQQEKPTIASLRDGQFFDNQGQAIMDPDLSNPTRRRTERPLETILSFEAAIDREYKKQREANRLSIAPGTDIGDNNGFESKRSSSYWAGASSSDYPNAGGNGGYYGSSGRGRQSSYFEGGQSRRNNNFGPRQYSDNALNRSSTAPGQGPYSSPSYGMTRDTINTGVSNGSNSDQWNNSTDPSSDNSSIERVKTDGFENTPHGTAQSRQPISEEGHYTYGQLGYNPNPMAGTSTPGAYNGQQFNGGPVVPPKAGPSAPRQIIRLGEGGNAPVYTPGGPSAYSQAPKAASSRPSKEEEEPRRKSWLKRTFSKKA